MIACSDEAYLNKFLSYQKWSENLPNSVNNDFLNFIETPSPLTKKLREKWLYKLAREKSWENYNKYYRGSEDVTLQCYALQAKMNTGNTQNLIPAITKLWLNGNSAPKACDEAFKFLLSNPKTNNKLINQRASLALSARNFSLTSHILKQSNPSQNQLLLLLNMVQQNPKKIVNLRPGDLHGDLYLYGLKLLTKNDPGTASKLYNSKAQTIMNKQQQQEFLAYFALYKALRNKDDAIFWINKVDKKYYTDALLDWEIRYAIAHKNWRKLLKLINNSKNKDDLPKKYWQARAYEGLGDKTKATEIYNKISSSRNYYGFLASKKLNKNLSFESEKVIHNQNFLVTYKPVMDMIKRLHTSKQTLQSSRMINDFSSELNKKDKSDFAYWIAEDLKWNGKSVYLCNTEELFNQLSLRFPLAHKNIVYENSKHYKISTSLIYAVIRQESAFFDEITSPAGANGLMQVMPATAKVVAKGAKISYSHPKDLYSPEKNITIGTAYLQQLSKRFNANPILMVAAYNSGPSQVNLWLKNNPQKDMDIWIETIPWNETRNYVKNVIAFYAIYQYRLYNKSNLDEFSRYF